MIRFVLRRALTWIVRTAFPGEFFGDMESITRLFGATPTGAMSMAARVLVHKAIEEEASRMTLTLSAVTHKGREEGEWIVSVCRALDGGD